MNPSKINPLEPPTENPLRELLKTACPDLAAAARLLGVSRAALEAASHPTLSPQLRALVSACLACGVEWRVAHSRVLRISVPTKTVDRMWNGSAMRKRLGLPTDVPRTRGELVERVRKRWCAPGKGVSGDKIAREMRAAWFPTVTGAYAWEPRNVKRMVKKDKRGRWPGVMRADDPLVPAPSYVKRWRELACEAILADALWWTPGTPFTAGMLPAERKGGRLVMESRRPLPAAWGAWAEASIAKHPWGAKVAVRQL